MILTGIVLGPYAFNLIDDSIIQISSELRKIALIIILTRAGLSLDLKELKKVGRPAILMCFVPACFEILGMILAGASVDDVFVIVLFSAFTGLAQGESISLTSLLQIPYSIITDSIAGLVLGYVLAKYFEKVHIRDTAKVAILLSVSFMLVTFEDYFGTIFPFAALLAVMGVGIALQRKRILHDCIPAERTVQAAIGGIPLAMGLPCGNIVLTVAVLAILITAPLGAFLIEHSYQKKLENE